MSLAFVAEIFERCGFQKVSEDFLLQKYQRGLNLLSNANQMLLVQTVRQLEMNHRLTNQFSRSTPKNQNYRK